MKIKINLGCGAQPVPGWVNLDRVQLPGTDVVHDLDVLPWPFEDESASEVTGEDIFEHVADPLGFMAECHRVLAPGGSLRLRTTWWQAENAYTDPTHRRFCTERTFDYWCQGTEFFKRYGAAYAGGRAFEKADVHQEGQELVVHLLKLGQAPVKPPPAPPVATWENPASVNELSRARLEEALDRVEAALKFQGADPVLLNEMRIIRMVSTRRTPWYGQSIDPADSSITVGVVLRNAFEALGDDIDYPTDRGLETRADHWFTRRYLPQWHRGKQEYQDWLDTLFRGP